MAAENHFRPKISHKAYDRRGEGPKPPGRLVGVIAVKSKNESKKGFNPYVLFFTVSPYRKDYNQVVDQIEQCKKARLPRYAQSLFHSCFKNW